MRNTIFIIIYCFVAPLNTRACRCMTIPLPKFSETYKNSDLVAFVRVSKYTEFYQSGSRDFPVAMEADIIYTHLGNVNKKTITIHGGDGGNCVNAIEKSLFKNKYLIVALYKYGDDYSFGSCGHYFVNVTIWIYLFYLITTTLLTFFGFRYYKKRKKRLSADTYAKRS